MVDAAQVSAMPDEQAVLLLSEDGLRIEVEAGRLKPIVLTLIDLFDQVGADGRLQLSPWDALRLSDLQRDPHWAFSRGRGGGGAGRAAAPARACGR